MMPAPMTRTGALSRERRLIGFSSLRERDRFAVIAGLKFQPATALNGRIASPRRSTALSALTSFLIA
jgi:hypothetical protein